MRLFNWIAIVGIGLYQETLSRYFRQRGLRCKHHASCSQYGVLAYRKYGFVQATVMTWKRWRDCRPGASRPLIDFP
jgi:putative component of membrane protein insertase Oxa1/YidC/SpoIIIJ protein YidD